MAPDPFFAVAADATGPGEAAGAYFDNCKVTPIIDAADYNAAVMQALDSLQNGILLNRTIVLANWWLGLLGGKTVKIDGTGAFSTDGIRIDQVGPYFLDPPDNTRLLIDELTKQARDGVNVYVMGWVSAALMSSSKLMEQQRNIARLNSATLQSINALRAEPKIGSQAIVNIANHPAASCHLKMFIVTTDISAVGFIGGLDFVRDRFAHTDHPGEERWHDAVAQIEGPAVQAMYEWCRTIWAQNLAMPAKTFTINGSALASRATMASGNLTVTPALPGWGDLSCDPGTFSENHAIQVCRTAPAFKIGLLDPNPAAFHGFEAFPDGCFEVAVALRKAIAQARKYVYIEDQEMSSVEIMCWLNQALKDNSDLRVILVTDGGADPNDAPDMTASAKLARAINTTLLKDLASADYDRVRLFRRFGDIYSDKDGSAYHFPTIINSVTPTGDVVRVVTADLDMPALKQDSLVGYQLVSGSNFFGVVASPTRAAGIGSVTVDVRASADRQPVVGGGALDLRYGITVHSKLTIIDDHWAMIGSANCMTRSLWSDDECSIGFVDPSGDAVVNFRAQLWAQHFNSLEADLLDLDVALNAWADSWGGHNAITRTGTLQEVPVPVHPAEFTTLQRLRIDTLDDVDSRKTWDYLPFLFEYLIDSIGKKKS